MASVKAPKTFSGRIIDDPPIARFLFSDVRMSRVWLVVRVRRHRRLLRRVHELELPHSRHGQHHGLLLVAAVLLIMAWKIAGYIGADYFLLRWLGVPWRARKPEEVASPLPMEPAPQASK